MFVRMGPLTQRQKRQGAGAQPKPTESVSRGRGCGSTNVYLLSPWGISGGAGCKEEACALNSEPWSSQGFLQLSFYVLLM